MPSAGVSMSSDKLKVAQIDLILDLIVDHTELKEIEGDQAQTAAKNGYSYRFLLRAGNSNCHWSGSSDCRPSGSYEAGEETVAWYLHQT